MRVTDSRRRPPKPTAGAARISGRNSQPSRPLPRLTAATPVATAPANSVQAATRERCRIIRWRAQTLTVSVVERRTASATRTYGITQKSTRM